MKTILTLNQDSISLSGPLVFKSVSEIWEQVRAHISACGKVTVDLAAVDHCDSAALALMTGMMREAKKNKVSIHFEHIPEQLLAIAQASRLEHALI